MNSTVNDDTFLLVSNMINPTLSNLNLTADPLHLPQPSQYIRSPYSRYKINWYYVLFIAVGAIFIWFCSWICRKNGKRRRIEERFSRSHRMINMLEECGMRSVPLPARFEISELEEGMERRLQSNRPEEIGEQYINNTHINRRLQQDPTVPFMRHAPVLSFTNMNINDLPSYESAVQHLPSYFEAVDKRLKLSGKSIQF